MVIRPLCDTDIGRQVIYLRGTDRQEEGVITSYNDQYVFVRYHGDLHSKATRHTDLTYARNIVQQSKAEDRP